jgi:ribosomal subunit interface protein
MIDNIQITGLRKYEVDPKLAKYITKKISKLDRFVPKNHRDGLKAEVALSEEHDAKHKNYKCEIIVHVNGQRQVANDSTINMYAAFDIVERKMTQLLTKYKETHGDSRLKSARKAIRKIIGRVNTR